MQRASFRRTINWRWNATILALLLLLAGCMGAPEQSASPAADLAAAAEGGVEAAAGAGSAEGALPPPANSTVPGSDGLTGTSEGQTSEGQTSEGQTSEGQAAEAEEGTPDVAALALAAPSRLLDSYRLAASYAVTSLLPGGAVHVASTEVQGDWVRTAGPFGFDAAFTLLNISGPRRQALALVVIDDDAAVQTDGAWSTIRRDAALPYADPDSLLSMPFVTRINQGENLGRERMEGVEVTHYRLTDPAVFSAAMADLLPSEAGTVESVRLEGWVADAGFVVQYILQATLAGAPFVDEAGNPLTVQQQIDASYVLRDLDGVAGVEWPADAQPPDTVVVPGFVPNTFPLPDGATATPRLGLLEVRTALTESEVAAFYRARLGVLGWAVAGELGFYTAAKEGQTINLTILPDEVSGETVVRVFAAGEDGVE